MRRGLCNALLEVAGMLLPEILPALLHLCQTDQPRLAIVTHALRVVVDHPFDAGQFILERENLIDLLLILGQHKARFRMLDNVLDLTRDRVLIERHGHAAERLRRDEPPVQLWAVIADDRELVATLETERGKTKGHRSDVVVARRPGVRLPDTKLFFADRSLVPMLTGVVQKQLGNSIHARRTSSLRPRPLRGMP